MTQTKAQPGQIKEHLLARLRTQDAVSKVLVRTTTLGWCHLTITTALFDGKGPTEREELIDRLLSEIGTDLAQYPIANYELLTPNEKSELIQDYIQLPLWSDVLMAPASEEPVTLDQDSSERPLVVTFYSFKGGVGRSTALGMVAVALANKNRRVVMLDFDLEAPGISVLFQPDIQFDNTEKFGVLDYIHQRSLTPEKDFPTIEDCVSQVNMSSRGELFLVSVGEYDENYIHRLAEFDRGLLQSFYSGNNNPVKTLISDISETLDPDIILIDARPGFSDISAVALFDLADTGIICFTPTDQSFEGLRFVVQAVRKQSEYRGKPDLRFLLTPMPIVSEDQSQAWISYVEDWIAEHWGLPNDVSVKELYHKVFYNPNVATLTSLANTEESILNDYLSIADAIDASLPDSPFASQFTQVEDHKRALNELEFQAARAQELAVENIPDVFQKTEDFPKFLNQKSWLISGAKGTGKSILFRLFVEQPSKAKALAGESISLQNFSFIAGHGEPRTGRPTLSSTSLDSYEDQVGKEKWAIFWLNYALLQICHAHEELHLIEGLAPELVELAREHRLGESRIVNWLIDRTLSPQLVPQASDELTLIDQWFTSKGRNIWLLYDELDAGFGFGEANYTRRTRALNALLAWWLESGINLKSITPKIFLREDIWSQLNFTNKGHYVARSLQLRWDESDLWRLTLRQALQSSETFRQSTERLFGITLERIDKTQLSLLRESLYPLWGERMGRGKKAYTYNWIRTRIADSNGNCFPRSLILLLQRSVERESNFSTEYTSSVILRPRALIEAFPYVSEQRVDEVRDEYPELESYLLSLQGERSPIDETRLAEVWKLDSVETSNVIKHMVEAGILKERSRPKDPPPRVYAVTELYLYGLNMTRKGQR